MLITLMALQLCKQNKSFIKKSFFFQNNSNGRNYILMSLIWLLGKVTTIIEGAKFYQQTNKLFILCADYICKSIQFYSWSTKFR